MTSLELLKEACDLHSQRKVARTLNRSVTAINQVLHDKYPKPEAILEMVELAYGNLQDTDEALIEELYVLFMQLIPRQHIKKAIKIIREKS